MAESSLSVVTPASARAGRREWRGLAVLVLPTLLVSMDLTVLHLAVPHLSEDLTPTSSQLLWIVDIYGFLIAGSLITMGTLGDRIGRRRLLLIGAAAFGVASVLAAFSTSAEMLITTRALLGIAGATLMPSTLGLIRAMFVDPTQRGLAIGVWASAFSAGTAIGPLVGGLLLDRFWWGSVFLLGVPLMLALLVLGPVVLVEHRDPHAGRVDLTSAALSLVGVLTVINGLKQTAENGVGWVPVGCMMAGLAAGVVFVVRQRGLRDPLIDLGLFRRRAFSVPLSAQTLALFAWVGTYLFVAQYLQLVLELSPFRAGLWMLPATAGSIVGSMLGPLAVRRTSPGLVIGGALVVAAAGFILLTRPDTTSGLGLVATGSVIFSIGVSPVVTLSTDMVIDAAPPERASAASAISETGTELGLALGVAVIGSFGTAVYRNNLNDNLPAALPEQTADAARETLGGAVATAQQLPGQLGTDLLDAARDAFTHAFQLAATASATVAIGVAAMAVVLLRRPRTGVQPEPLSALTPDHVTAPTDGVARILGSVWAPGQCATAGARAIDSIDTRRMDMTLASYAVRTSIAVSDIAQAADFYEATLGLAGTTDPHDDSRIYMCGGGTSLHVYESPTNAGTATATLATWCVADLEQVIDELTANGVAFEHYDHPQLKTDEKGIHTLANGKVAWFKDPDGNTFALEQSR